MNPLSSWTEEQRSAYLYRPCAEAEAGTVRAELFVRLAGEAEAQAAIWRAQLTARGHPPPPPFAPDPRTRLVARLVRWVGPRRLRPVLAAMKVRGMAVYATSLGADAGHPAPVAPGAVEFRHRGLGSGGNLRAAVFGVNDGLVSNASLILGVAGASADTHLVLVSGVAGLAAGAFAAYVRRRSYPAVARARAIAAPMPRLPPVTSATGRSDVVMGRLPPQSLIRRYAVFVVA